ncbi:MAG: J domain-containing protein [Thiolinea sp.]
MDNWHTAIILSLMAFGTGHAVFRSRVGFWKFLLFVMIGLPLYLEFQGVSFFPLTVICLMLGFAYAHRDTVMVILENVWYRISCMAGLFRHHDSGANSQQSNHRHNPDSGRSHSEAAQQTWQEEQARREQEAKAQRQQQQQKSGQQHGHQERKNNKPKSEREQWKRKKAEYQQRREQQRQHEQKKQEYQQEQKRTGSTSSEVTTPERDTRNPMEVLGLQPGFTAEELKKAYKRESARCHPDRWQNKPEAIRKMMEQEQKQVNWAYQQLK